MIWIFGAAVSAAQSVQNAVIEQILQNGGLVTLTSQRDNGRIITETEEFKLVTAAPNAENKESQWWLIQPLGDGSYALRSYATGRYVQSNSPHTTGDTRVKFYIRASVNATDSKPLVTISSNASFSGKSCLHDENTKNVVNWYAATTTDSPASDWAISVVEEVEANTLKDYFAHFSGHVEPGNKVVMIRNVETGKQICEFSDNKLIAADASAEDFSQFWLMEQSGTAGQYTLRNVKTNRYFSYTAYSSGHRYFNDQPTVTSKGTSCNYVFTPTPDDWELSFSISSPNKTSEYYTHANTGNAPTDRQQCYIYNIDQQSTRTRWYLIETELDADDVAKAQEAFNTYKDIEAKKTTYTSAMNKYFTDASYSELNDTYKNKTAEELRSAMTTDKLPQYLIDIALKVKNDTWSEEDVMSKDFRVADYQVYSDNMKSPRLMGVGYGFGRLSNPTGIVVKSGDMVSIFCDRGAAPNTELKLEVVKDTDAAGTTYTLNQGINIFSFSGAATLYIFYQTVGGNDFSIATAPKLADCPDVKIHIEGGRLQGYYDKTRNHNNETWAHLRTDLLKESNVMNVKTDNFVLCFNKDRTVQACPTDMVRTVEAWDNMARWENDLMGYNDEHIPGLSTVHRNIYNFFSKEKYMGGSMMTALYGVQTLSGNIAGHMSYAQMESDGVWGPAHENGHLRQNLIYTLGSLESSCNLFSEAVTYELGHSASRTAYSSAIFDKFAKNTAWLGFQGSEITRMFQQLYLYFHVNNVMPDFYPRLFDELRADPMVHNISTHEVKGGEEYLKLAVKMCKVANADLSDFFEVYGFFRPQNRQQVYENGIFWYLTTTQAEIDAALTEMHKYPKKYGNIIFIEDRIEAVPATYRDAPANAIKNRSNDPAHAGNVGQYTTFLEKTPNIDNYYYSVADDGVVTVHGTGARGLVGFKVYDASNNLVCLSNFLNFTLPEGVRSQNYTVKAALSTGADVELGTTPSEIDIPEPEPEPDTQTVTYDFYINGNKVFSEDHQVTLGTAEYPNFTAAQPYGITYTKPEGPVTNAATKNISVTWNLPFEYTPSITAANVAWYNLRVNTPGTNNCYYYDSTQSPNVKGHAATPGEDPKYLWAFVGDPFNGFVIYNKAAGTDKALNNDNKCNISAAGLNVKFKLEAGNGNRTGEFSIVDPAIQNGNKYLNGNNDLGRYSKDNGSSFAVTKVELTPDPEEPDTPEALAAAKAAYEAACGDVWEFLEDNESEDEAVIAILNTLYEQIGEIEDTIDGETATVADYTGATAAIYEAIEEARAAIEALSNPVEKDWEAYGNLLAELMTAVYGEEEGDYGSLGNYHVDNMSEDEVYEALTAFMYTLIEENEASYDQNMTAMNFMKSHLVINQPKPGTFFTLKGSGSTASKYLKIASAGANMGYTADNATPDANSIFYLDDAGRILSFANGLYTYCSTANSSRWQLGNLGTSASYTFGQALNGAGQPITGHYYIGVGLQWIQPWDNSPQVANNGHKNDNQSGWVLKEVTSLPVNLVSVAGAYYASFHAPVAVTIPAGVTAYTGKVQGDVLVLTAVEGSTLGAYTPVILYSETLSTADMALTTDGTPLNSDLSGTIAAVNAAEGSFADAYVLNKSGDNVGFYKTTTKINGFKAYLPASAGASSNTLSFRFEDTLTAIDALHGNTNDAEIYDLQGRRLVKAQQGMNIINGHKVFVK